MAKANSTRSEELFARAKEHIPGGVNSPVRAFLSVGGTPRFISRAEGQYMYDEDGNRYLDYVGSWGPMLLGHNHPAVAAEVAEAVHYGLSFGAATKREVDMAELICGMVPWVEMVRMVNSGTEAVMSAVRAARGFTGRDKVIKFEGCYHGHADCMLVKAGSGALTTGVPDSLGVPEGCARDTLTAVYNDPESVERLLRENEGQVACIIVEPVAANMGVVPPKEGFLAELRRLADAYGALLIFDEVITGFRLGLQGAAGYYGVRPDLVTYGKIIGGGMPVGAYGGRKDVMRVIAPLGSVYQAGTLSGNPIAMAAGLATLNRLKDHPEIYTETEKRREKLCEGIRKLGETCRIPLAVNGVGSLMSVFFTEGPVTDCASAKKSDTKRFAKYFHGLLDRGIYIGPSQFEAMFLSAAHTDEDIDMTLEAAEEVLRTLAD